MFICTSDIHLFVSIHQSAFTIHKVFVFGAFSIHQVFANSHEREIMIAHKIFMFTVQGQHSQSLTPGSAQ